MNLARWYAGIFILETIQDAFTYSYECVEQHEFDEAVDAVLAAGFPHGLCENFEKLVISFVYRQAKRDGWLEHLTEFDELNTPESKEGYHQ